MIGLLSKLEVHINERVDQIEMLKIDEEEKLLQLLRDDERRRTVIRNFRLIRKAEKVRIMEQQKILEEIAAIRELNRNQIILYEEMIVNSINRYLNTQIVCKKHGNIDDVILAFQAYYQQIQANKKAKEMKVIRNLHLFQQVLNYQTKVDFSRINLSFILNNMRESLNHIFDKEKLRVFRILKIENAKISLSPEKKIHENEDQKEEQEDKYRVSKTAMSKKRKHQLYCYQLSRILNLENVYLYYYFFNEKLYGGDIDRKRRILELNLLKRNLEAKAQIESYKKDYNHYITKMNNNNNQQQQQQHS